MRDIHIGQLIDQFSKRQKWTRAELSNILDISPSNMHKKLNAPDLDTSFLKKVANAAGVEVQELFTVTVNQRGNYNTVGESTIHYGHNPANDRIFRERIKGLEAENEALKNHITTLNRLIAAYEKK